MGGKVFAESSSIYQDEAKVLFDYYKNAAEAIVAEEKNFERQIEEKKRNISDLIKASKKAKTGGILGIVFCAICAIGGGVLLLFLKNNIGYALLAVALGLGIFALVKFLQSKKNKKLSDAEKEKITVLEDEKKNIRRDYKVSKLGVALVPVASRVPFEGKSFLVDHTGTVENTKFSISVLHKPDEFKESLSELEEKLSNVPVVESNENAEQIDSSDYSVSMQNVTMHDYIGTIDREVRNISYLLSDSDVLSVSLPVIEPNSAEDEFLKEYATTETEGRPVVNVFDVSDYDEKLNKFSEINEIKKSINAQDEAGGNIKYFKNLIKQLGDSVQILTDVKTNSVSKLLDYSNMILAGVLKSGYNHYSPVLEADEIERIRNATFNYQDGGEDYQPFNLKKSSLVRYELFSQAWYAEDGSRTNYPFGMHQVQEEVLMPVLNNLLNETRIERLKIYNNIKDQKMNYLNKWNQDIELAFRDNRARGQELVTEITNAYAEYNTAFQTYMSYKNTLDKMSAGQSDGQVEELENSEEQIAGFQIQAQQCNKTRDEFQDFMDRLTEDIERKGDEFNRIELYEASLRDSLSRDFARAQTSETMQSLDERRRKLVQINPYYAANAELPPEPSMEPSLMEDFVIGVNKEANDALRIIEEKENLVSDEEDESFDMEAEAEPEDSETEEDVPEEKDMDEESQGEEEYKEYEPKESESVEPVSEEVESEEPEDEESEEEESELEEDTSDDDSVEQESDTDVFDDEESTDEDCEQEEDAVFVEDSDEDFNEKNK